MSPGFSAQKIDPAWLVSLTPDSRPSERAAYVRRGRRQQGRLLRMAGFRHRGTQRPAIRLLRKIGIDLMSFTTSISVQREDVMEGLRLLREELTAHREAFRCVPSNTQLDKSRRMIPSQLVANRVSAARLTLEGNLSYEDSSLLRLGRLSD